MNGKMIKASKLYPGIYYRIDCGGNKMWYVSFTFKGKTTWKKIGSKHNVLSAVDVRTEMLKELTYKEDIAVMTLNDAFSRWMQAAETDGLKAIASDASRYGCHIGMFLGSKNLDRISPNDVKLLHEQLIEKGLQPSTALQIVTLVGRIYRRMKDLGLYHGNIPTDSLRFKDPSVERLRFLTKDEAKALMLTLKGINKYSYYFAAFALYAGMRKSEILRMKPEDIDLENKRIRIQTKHRNKKQNIKYAVIFDELFQIALYMKKYTDGFSVFPERYYYQAVDAQGLNNGIDVKDRANRVCFHTLRHTFGSLLAADGVAPRTIQTLMRHDNFKSTEKYLHTSDNILDKVVEDINAKRNS